MAKNTHQTLEPPDETAASADAIAQTLMDRGRAVADQLPDVVDSAREMVGAAQGQVDDLSDQGVLAAAAFSAGIAVGLLLAGAPRIILALALMPTALTVRSAMQRGIRPSGLVN